MRCPVSSDCTTTSASSHSPTVPTVKSTSELSGRNSGQRWLNSPRLTSSVVTRTGVLPSAATRWSADPASGANTIVPSAPQVPPKPPPASQSVIGGPPATGTFFNLPSAKKPIHWLSGEKNGLSALVVPGTTAGAVASSRRSSSWVVLPRPTT